MSPTISSPSCEIKNELIFPSLPLAQVPQSQPQEQPKAPPKISQLSELDQQLSKLHNQRPVLPHQQSYSDAVRQSPITVQQQVVPPNSNQPVQALSQAQRPSTPAQSADSAAPQSQIPPNAGLERKLSRFVISKVSEPSPSQHQQTLNIQPPQHVQSQSIPKSTVSSPDVEQFQAPSGTQQQQAQMFFQQNHGSVVSKSPD